MRKKLPIRLLNCALSAAVLLSASPSHAKVSEEEARRLGNDLTPVGAEVAGNIDGTIPAWTGGITEPPEGYVQGKEYVDPFADDPIRFTITQENYKEAGDKLTEGHKALLNTYPDTYKLHIYPTHRSASYSQKVYDALKENATSAELLPQAVGVRNGKTTSPFPIPQSAEEVLWNHVLRYRGEKMSSRTALVTPTKDGSYTPIIFDRDYFFIYTSDELDSKRYENKFLNIKTKVIAPAKQAGNINLVHESIDQISSPRKAWQYFPGQRRLRRSPSLSYDSDLPQTDSLKTVDQFDMFNGAPDQYNWTLVGKKEMYVPYNSYRLNSEAYSVEDIIRPGHINQDLARYELHRVWVVEGELRVGIQHIYAKRRLYVDEDSWQVLVTEEYDNDQKIWRVQEAHAMNYYDSPMVWTALDVTYDLQSGRYVADGLDNEFGPVNLDADLNIRDFSTSAVRREAKR